MANGTEVSREKKTTVMKSPCTHFPKPDQNDTPCKPRLCFPLVTIAELESCAVSQSSSLPVHQSASPPVRPALLTHMAIAVPPYLGSLGDLGYLGSS